MFHSSLSSHLCGIGTYRIRLQNRKTLWKRKINDVVECLRAFARKDNVNKDVISCVRKQTYVYITKTFKHSINLAPKAGFNMQGY